MAGIDDLIASESAQNSAPTIDHLIANESGAAPAAQATSAAPAAQQEPGFLSTIGAGLGHGFGAGVLGAEQLVGKGLGAIAPSGSPAEAAANAITNDANRGITRINAEYSPYANARPYTAGAANLAGGVAATALPAGAVARGGALVGGALSGATGAAMEPVDPSATDYWSQKAQQAGAGAVGGALTGGLTAGVSRLIGGVNTSPAARDLMDRGVPLTPGQIMGGGGNRAEQAMTSIPIVGNSIANARNRGIAEFNRAAYSDALAPIGQTLPDNVAAGGAGVAHVGDQIGQAYDALEGQALFNYDGQFHRDLTGIRQGMLAAGAPQNVVDQFDNIVRGNITNKMDPNTGEMTGQQWAHTRSQLSTIVRNNTLGQPTADQRALADGVDALGQAVNDNVVRNSPQGIQADLTAANNAYARYKTIERAAGYTGARNSGNVFTPAQYSAAVGARSTAAQKATNTGLNAGLAQNAQQVLGTTVPDSGTAGRSWLTSLLLAPHLIAHPGILAGGAAASAAYSRPGIAAVQRLLTQRPAAAQALGRALNPLSTPAATGAGVMSGGLLGMPDQQE